MKIKPNNSDWQERLISLLIGMRLSIKNKLELDRFISSELQEAERKALDKGWDMGLAEGKFQTLKEVEGIIGLDEFRVGQVYFFKKQLLSKIKELKER